MIVLPLLDKSGSTIPSQMTPKDLMEELTLSATFVKAALVRSVWDADLVIGRNTTRTQQGVIVNDIYTADFQQEKNLVFVDRFYLPRIWDVMREGWDRQMPVNQLFGKQAVHAVGTRTVSDYNFDELTNIVYPSSKNQKPEGIPVPEASNVVRLFPRRAISAP